MTVKSFETYINELNAAQRQAVTTIEGPVLVVAGPGTGKTQLLAMRAANIARTTDTAPSSILCLTFTESAATAMRKRLIQLMGPEGNKVAVHTFHSFGAEIINHHPEYFYNGAQFSAGDELTTHELLRTIFSELPHSSPLSKTMNGEFTALKDAQMAISHLKRGGLLPDELLAVLDHNQAFCDFAEPLVAAAFANRLSKKDIPGLQKLAQDMGAFKPEKLQVHSVKPLSELATAELQTAVDEAAAAGKTNTLTAWRNRWCEKDHLAHFVFKDRAKAKKLRALAKIYAKYRELLQERELFDFDDMVSLVAHTCETTPELRYNLQEQYLYVMVDEFQDTNGAQTRLLTALTDNPVHEGRPNILAVGDDDQAIYSFQGAELSNILDFAKRYRDPAIITLTDNYRSTAPVLQQSRDVITQGTDRLETTLEHINKELTAHTKLPESEPQFHQFASQEDEYNWIAQSCAEQLKNGTPGSEIAVLARTHRQLIQLLPYLHAAGVPVNYERRSNVLESPHIIELLTLVEVVVQLGEQRYDIVESLLPEVLSYDFWGLTTSEVWQLSLTAYKNRKMWLEVMIEQDGKLRRIAEFLIVASHQALHESSDTMLDILIGTTEQQVGEDEHSDDQAASTGPSEELFISPYRAFYFTEQRLQANPGEYLTLLSSLRAIRRAVQNYEGSDAVSLRDFLDVVQLFESTNTPILDVARLQDGQEGVELMTAHKSKGLEFKTVFIVSCHDDIWGRRARRPSSSISFPHNLPLEPAGHAYMDALRLFFVAMTRAKQELIMTCHTSDARGKERLIAEFLQDTAPAVQLHSDSPPTPIEQFAPGWQQKHVALPKIQREVLLSPTLENYKLSATHLNNFIDVTRGGPQSFLLQNLLRFPQAMTGGQVFGQAIHAVLQRAHTHAAATGEKRPVEDILHDYELQLQKARLSERDMTYLLEKGSDVLQKYLAAKYHTFTPQQKAERNFAGQGVVVEGVRLNGAIDLMETDEEAKTIRVIDYKTGKGHSAWRPTGEFDKIKLHKYRQQLMLYKLLVENSRDYAKYTVTSGVLEFVEPDHEDRLHRLEMSFDAQELADFKVLVQAVWRHIHALEFPDTSKYTADLAGIHNFEAYLKTSAA